MFTSHYGQEPPRIWRCLCLFCRVQWVHVFSSKSPYIIWHVLCFGKPINRLIAITFNTGSWVTIWISFSLAQCTSFSFSPRPMPLAQTLVRVYPLAKHFRRTFDLEQRSPQCDRHYDGHHQMHHFKDIYSFSIHFLLRDGSIRSFSGYVRLVYTQSYFRWKIIMYVRQ